MTDPDWNYAAEQIGAEHKAIIKATLPTPSFCFLLEAYIRNANQRLTGIDISLSAEDFKQKYVAVRREEAFARSLLQYVKSLTNKPL